MGLFSSSRGEESSADQFLRDTSEPDEFCEALCREAKLPKSEEGKIAFFVWVAEFFERIAPFPKFGVAPSGSGEE